MKYQVLILGCWPPSWQKHLQLSNVESLPPTGRNSQTSARRSLFPPHNLSDANPTFNEKIIVSQDELLPTYLEPLPEHKVKSAPCISETEISYRLS